MPTVFVYEFCCAFGVGREPTDPAHSLYREGAAMRDALVADFQLIPGMSVTTLELPAGVKSDREAFRERAKRCDWTLVIAPEIGGMLAERCRWVREVNGKLLGPSVEAVELTADKHALSKVWDAAKVRTPRTRLWAEWLLEPPRYPVVCKPIDGAGSSTTFLVPDAEHLPKCLVAAEAEGYTEDRLLLQDLVEGLAVSVSFLIGPSKAVPLAPAFQLLSTEGRFRYQGGALPIRPNLAERAVRVARQAIGCVEGLLGYVGVDLILGAATDGSADYAIEINPRLTTSYVGLRELCDGNLAEAMLVAATGGVIEEPGWKPGRVHFLPDGRLTHDPTPGAVYEG